jgi:hypothetical protein
MPARVVPIADTAYGEINCWSDQYEAHDIPWRHKYRKGKCLAHDEQRWRPKYREGKSLAHPPVTVSCMFRTDGIITGVRHAGQVTNPSVCHLCEQGKSPTQVCVVATGQITNPSVRHYYDQGKSPTLLARLTMRLIILLAT